MNLGILQTRGTCWFYTILNGFLLSEDGQKIMYANLQEYYAKLTPTEKAYFDDRLDAPCPMKDLTKTKKIYFWKFIDQYMCLLSGPRAVSLKIAKSANLLGNMNLQGTVAKVTKGGTGAHPQQEIEKVLDHLGFKGKYYSGRVDRRRNPQFVISKAGDRTYMSTVSYTVAPGYSLMCAGLVIGNSLAASSEQHRFHSIVGYVVDQKGYIFDSNQRKVFRCNWWHLAEFKRVVRDEISLAYSFFKDGQVNVHNYSYAIYARDAFTKGISPSCRMKYRNIDKSPVIYGLNYADPNAGKLLNQPMYNYLKPAERAAAKRRWAQTHHTEVKYLTKATLDAILKSATSKGNALNQVYHLRNAGYRVVTPNYVNFHKTLAAMKFPTKYFNKPMYDKILQNATNKVNAQKRINKLKKAGYVMKVDNFTSFKQKVNEKFKNDPYAKAKALLGKATTVTQRKKAYSEVWKNVPMPRRKVLMHYRNKGVWLRNNAFNVGGGSSNNLVLLPNNNGAGSSNQPLRNARSHVNTLKTAVARKAYLKAVVLSAEQRKNLRAYIAQKNANARAARAAKKSS
jgi:hypothetical protein